MDATLREEYCKILSEAGFFTKKQLELCWESVFESEEKCKGNCRAIFGVK
jgi:hypothetical protein